MKVFVFFLLPFALFFAACRPAAAPVSISNKPASINDVKQPKALEEMSWTKFDGRTNADGATAQLKDFEGKVVILDFWATYCPPCIEEIPHLRALQKQYGKENLEIIGLHVGGDEDRPLVPAFSEKLKIDYPLATPENELVSFIFGGQTAIPQTAVFDRKGRMITKITGFDAEVKKQLDAAVERAVNSK